MHPLSKICCDPLWNCSLNSVGQYSFLHCLNYRKKTREYERRDNDVKMISKFGIKKPALCASLKSVSNQHFCTIPTYL